MIDDDQMMLNISIKSKIPKNDQKQQENAFSKTDKKRMKYSQKIREKTKMSRKKLQIPIKGISNLQEKNKPQLVYEQPSNTIKTDIKKQRKPQRTNNDDVRPPSLHKKRIIKNQKPLISNFDPNTKIKVDVNQLMPENRNEMKKKLDINQLEAFDLHPKLQQSLIKNNVTKLTDIQVKSFGPLFNSRSDAVIKANTGSGKTLAYLIPLINRILQQSCVTKREDGLTILIICPTRELCIQGQKQTIRCLKRTPYIVAGCLYGGQQTNHQKARLRKGTNILFCTPGRVVYHLEHTKCFKISNIKQIIFEEADRTLDMGFQSTVQKIISIIGEKLPLSHTQKVLVSAHFNNKVSSLLQSLEMDTPKFIGFEQKNQESENLQQMQQMNLQKLRNQNDTEINTSQNLKQQYLLLTQDQKIPFLLAYVGLLKEAKILIFVSTIDQVEFLDYLFNNLKYKDSNGIQTDTRFQNRPIFKIHGDLDQKLRTKTYLSFRQSKDALLISTEVASRGLDFPDLSYIILFDVPPSITDYGNRVGRSGRFNQTGVSLLLLHYQQSDYAEKIRYFCPDLELIDKDLVFDGYNRILKSMNIGDNSLHYIQGLVRSSVKDDDEKYQLARKAYVSMLRAYARLPDRNIFAVKKLNLKLVSRTFGLNSAKAGKQYNPKAKQSHLEAIRKKRKVQDVRKLQVSEYL